MIPAICDSTPLAPLSTRAADYVRAAKSAATVLAYRGRWGRFTAWCDSRAVSAMPADPRSVALYLADSAGTISIATLALSMAAINKAHEAAGFEAPATMKHAAVSEVWKGIRRVHGTAQRQKAPVTITDIRRMVDCASIRDRALLLIGFAGAFRRSELVALNVADIEQTADGLVVTLRRSKTDQDGAGRKVGIPYGGTPGTCPVRAYVAWLEAGAITEGAVFRSINRHGHIGGRLCARAVALIVKKHAEAAGLDPALYAGHSLRAGLATSAAMAGVSERSIMQQTGHRSVAMVRRYIRDGSLFRENAAGRIGL